MAATDLIVYKKAEELLYKIYPKLINYPKSEKFSLCQSIKDNFFNLLKFISLGNSVRSKRTTYLQEADGHLQVLKVLIKLSKQRKYIKGGPAPPGGEAMQLNFEHTQKVTDGGNPAAYHSPDNVLQVFYVNGGRMYAVETDTPMGRFDNRQFTLPALAAPDTSVQNLSVSYLPRINLWATWCAGSKHRMAVFLLKQETNRYLVDGDLSFTDDDPVVSLSLTLDNPKGIIAAEEAVDVPPGTRIGVYFRIGDSSRVALGNYYLDRIVTKVGDPQVTLTARNATGKLLKDQTFDENNTYSGTVTAVLEQILDYASVITARVEYSSTQITAEFPHNMSLYDGIKAIISTRDWQIKEDVTGTITIGSASFIQQVQPAGLYLFERGRDCFGREVERDDRETYSRVCVHDREFVVKAWRDVTFLSTWNLPRRKTLYVEAPEGTTQGQANSMAASLASRLAQVGVVESFAAPFRPHLQPGDQASIIEPGKLPRTLGTITQVGLQFGRSGFFTDFTVDSGGMIRKPRIKDLIEQISGKRDVGSAKIE